MVILAVKGTPFIDVFLGEGWKNWSRCVVHKGLQKVAYFKGNNLSPAMLSQLNKRYGFN